MKVANRTRTACILAGVLALLAALTAPMAPSAHAESLRVAAPTRIAVEQADGSYTFCTLAAIGRDKDNRNSPRGITAGHCADEGTAIGQDVHLGHGTEVGRRIGTILDVTRASDDVAPDAASIEFLQGIRVTTRVSLHGEESRPVKGVLAVRDVDALRPVLCMHGSTTGYQCGPLGTVSEPLGVLGVDGLSTAEGDSGAGVFAVTDQGLYLAGMHTAADGTGVPMELIANRLGVVW